jgi:hypothetical protein
MEWKKHYYKQKFDRRRRGNAEKIIKALLIAYQKQNAKYLTIIEKRVCKIYIFLNRIIAVIKGWIKRCHEA